MSTQQADSEPAEERTAIPTDENTGDVVETFDGPDAPVTDETDTDATADDDGDEVSMDAADMMAGPRSDDTEETSDDPHVGEVIDPDEVEEEPRERFDSIQDLVTRGASMIKDGVIDFEDLYVPDHFDDYAEEELVEDVRERLDERERSHTTEETVEDVDWTALWTEFGFDTPDVTGRTMASKTQLQTALECTDQPIAGSPTGHIQEALEEGKLDTRTVIDADGVETVSGYILQEQAR